MLKCLQEFRKDLMEKIKSLEGVELVDEDGFPVTAVSRQYYDGKNARHFYYAQAAGKARNCMSEKLFYYL